jgi:large subunit ribosomal protein L10
MSKLVKNLITEDLVRRYGNLDSALWVELVGVDGIKTNEFRRQLRARNITLEIVKTALFRRAVEGRPLNGLAKKLGGPAALVTGGDSLIDAAKTIEEWMPKLGGLKLRGASLEGQFLDEKTAAGLSKMPNKRDLLARVAMIIRSPGANLAAAIQSGGARIGGCVKALMEKLEKAEPTPEPTTEAAPEPTPQPA